nr:unnamed protein product [Callosobruchus analis]
MNRLISAYKPRFKPNYQEIQSFDQLYYKILSVAATLANNSAGVRPQSVKALKILKIDDLSSFFLFYIALRNLDPVTRREFEQTVEQEEIPTFQGLIMFVEKHLRVIEMSESKTIPHTKHSSYKSVNTFSDSKPGTSKSSKACLSAVSVNKSNVKNCLFCQKPHSIYKCFEYNELTPPERLKKVKELKLCENCLRINHSVAQCLSKIRCSVCKQMHHHTLHIDCNAISDNSQLQAAGSSKDQAVTLTCSSSSNSFTGYSNCSCLGCLGYLPCCVSNH